MVNGKRQRTGRCGGAGRFCTALVFLGVLLLAVGAGSQNALATMYVCWDAGGSMQFTNAPTGSDCRPYGLKKNGWLATSGRASSSSRLSGANYDQHIRSVGRRYSVDPSLIKAIIHTESDFNHRAVSRKGAQGLMQLMPDTARELRVSDPFDPLENIEGGTRYLRQLLDNFGNNLILSLAAYNAGPGLVQRTGGVPAIDETRNYVKKVLRRYKVYKASFTH